MCCWVRFQFTHRHDVLSSVGESQLVIVIVTVIISGWVQLRGFSFVELQGRKLLPWTVVVKNARLFLNAFSSASVCFPTRTCAGDLSCDAFAPLLRS